MFYFVTPREGFFSSLLEDSDESFLEALGDVAAAMRMTTLAGRAGVARQAAYRMLSKTGNPTYHSLTAILRALGLRIAIEADIVDRSSQPARKPIKLAAAGNRAATGKAKGR